MSPFAWFEGFKVMSKRFFQAFHISVTSLTHSHITPEMKLINYTGLIVDCAMHERNPDGSDAFKKTCFCSFLLIFQQSNILKMLSNVIVVN